MAIYIISMISSGQNPQQTLGNQPYGDLADIKTLDNIQPAAMQKNLFYGIFKIFIRWPNVCGDLGIWLNKEQLRQLCNGERDGAKNPDEPIMEPVGKTFDTDASAICTSLCSFEEPVWWRSKDILNSDAVKQGKNC